MNQGWVTKKLKDVCVLQRGFDLPKKDRESGNFPLISSSGAIDFHSEAKVAGPGIVTGRSGSIGQVFFVEEDFWPLNTSLYIKEFHGNYPRFIYYLLKSFDLGSYTSGAGVPTLNRNHVHDEDVLIPLDIEEQKRIVAILDQAFADIDKARALTEQNLKNARELFESYLQQVFSQRGEGWKIGPVKDIADTCLGKMLDKQKNKGALQPYLRNMNVQWFSINTDDLLEMRIEEFEDDRYSVKNGDLLICEGGYPGRGAIWDKDENIFFQKALHRVRCHKVIFNKWLLYFLYLGDCDGSLRKHFTGAGIQHFTGSALKNFQLPIPSEVQAKEYVKTFDELFLKVKDLENIYHKKLDAIDELKKSLLQKAFSGELTKDSEEAAA